MTHFLLLLILLTLLGVNIVRLTVLGVMLAGGLLATVIILGILTTAMWWLPVAILIGIIIARLALAYGKRQPSRPTEIKPLVRPTLNFCELPPDYFYRQPWTIPSRRTTSG